MSYHGSFMLRRIFLNLTHYGQLYNYSCNRQDFSSDEEYESFFIKDVEFSVRYGFTGGFSGTTPISKKTIKFNEEDYLDVDNKK